MTEHFELRVPSEHASKVFDANEGRDLGGIRVIRISASDPRLIRISKIQQQLRSRGDFLVVGWRIIRRYDPAELLDVPWLWIRPTKPIQACGEEYSTKYDDSQSCVICGWGAKQDTYLDLPPSSVPAGHDLTVTWTGEWVASTRFMDAFGETLASCVSWEPIIHSTSRVSKSAAFVQMRVNQSTFAIDSRTILRDHLIDYPGAPKSGVCPFGHTLGLNVISELYVKPVNGKFQGPISATQNGFGQRRGLYRPTPAIIVSQEFYRRFHLESMCGLRFEAAHMIEP
jgi:hypothetical protein